MQPENRKCENCGRHMPRAAYIPFNSGMIVCLSCCEEWEKLGKPQSIVEFYEAVYKKEDYQNNLIAAKE